MPDIAVNMPPDLLAHPVDLSSYGDAAFDDCEILQVLVPIPRTVLADPTFRTQEDLGEPLATKVCAALIDVIAEYREQQA